MKNLLKSLRTSFQRRFRTVGQRPRSRKFKHRLLLEPLELRRLPASLSFTPFPIPLANAQPFGIAAGADGNLWFTQARLGHGEIGRITPTGAITEFSLPSGAPGDITPGPDGNLWFTLDFGTTGGIGRISTAGVITEFTLPEGASPNPGGITTGPDGNLWFTDGGSVGQITPAGTITEFSLSLDPSVEAGAITTGPDGNLWIVTSDVIQGGTTGRPGEPAPPIVWKPTAALKVTPSGQVANTYSLAPAIRGSITTGPDGNLWFTGTTLGGTLAPSDTIGRITTTGVVTYFNTPTFDGNAAIITAGPDGNLWFTENLAARIGQITPSGVITEFAGLYRNPPGAGVPITTPEGIVTGPDRNLWYVDTSANQVIRINLNANPPAGAGTNWLDRVYGDLLHRAVDPVGQSGWTDELNAGVSRQIIVSRIEQSVEYRTDEVQHLYQQFLQRSAEPGGLNGWVSALGSGMTIQQVEAAMAGSPEFFQNAGGTNQGFVTALYSDLLHRAPDPGGQAMVLAALSGGVSRQAVAAAVLSSPEFYADLVSSLYGQFLQRAPDSFGFNLSMQALGNGFSEEGLIAVFLGSDEYFVSSTD
jgi:virginiamycin B lyase